MTRPTYQPFSTHALASDVNTNMQLIPAGSLVEVEGYWDEITGGSWMTARGNFACLIYAIRSANKNLPLDDDVLYVKYDGLGSLVHISEISEPTDA